MDAKRKEELELKKRRLAELRKAREERKSALENSHSSTSSLASPAQAPDFPLASGGGSRDQVDDLVTSLIGSQVSLNTAASESSLVAAPGVSAVSLEDLKQAREVESRSRDQVMKRLQFSEIMTFEVPAKTTIIYDKEVQTNQLPEEELDVERTAEKDKAAAQDAPISASQMEKLRAEILEEELAKVRELEQRAAKEKREKAAKLESMMSNSDRENILKSPALSTFIAKSSKVIERMMAESPLIYRDYSIDYQSLKSATSGTHQKMSVLACMHQEHSKNSMISSVQWSNKFPELCLASYTGKSQGSVLVWNMALPSRPEFVFESQSPVATAIFCDSQPAYIFGGCQSGQILLWDTRANRRTPSLKSPLSANGHTHPIVSLSLVGTQNLYQLMSFSADGKMCSWQLDMLGKPLESLELNRTVQSRNEEVILSAVDFFPQDTASFMIGAEDGLLNQVNRYDKAGSKAGVHPLELYQGHTAPVTSMMFQKQFRQSDQEWMLMTSSFDWTVKLWKVSTKRAMTATTFEPVCSFDAFSDYVVDTKWNPVHPSIFAAAEASGKLHLWNMLTDMEAPLDTLPMETGISSIAWNADGSRLAVGSVDGKLSIVNVPQTQMAASNDDTVHMRRLLNKMSDTSPQMER
eukprot:Partr_v1_DN26574_c0_g1_i1_m3643 putative intermediate chain